jgi:hypothetical protein
MSMLVPTLLRNEPIYDSLRDDLLRRERRRVAAPAADGASDHGRST